MPQVNYRDESSEDDFDSPLQSPTRPPPTRAGSPVKLAVPTLNDNVDEELEAVSRTLNNVGHTHTFRGTRPETRDRPEPEGVEADHPEQALPHESDPDLGEEVVEEGHVVGVGVNLKVGAENEEPELAAAAAAVAAANMPDQPVDYDRANTENGDRAQDHARSVKVEFNATDIRFWFSELEAEMLTANIGKQWLKKTVLQRNLPTRQKEDVKALLTLTETQAGPDIYFKIKNELIRIYAPKPKDSYCKALTRTMVGLPSQLGNQIVDDVCKKPVKLDGCCCAAAVEALWHLQLPVHIRAHVSNMEFSKATFKQVFEAADKVFLSAKQVQVAAVATPQAMDETLPAFFAENQPQVAAVSKGQGKGQGGGKGNKGNKGNKGQGGQGQNKGQGQGQARSRGKRHSSNPPDSCCDRHYVHGDQAFFCLKPLSCPWVSKVIEPSSK